MCYSPRCNVIKSSLICVKHVLMIWGLKVKKPVNHAIFVLFITAAACIQVGRTFLVYFIILNKCDTWCPNWFAWSGSTTGSVMGWYFNSNVVETCEDWRIGCCLPVVLLTIIKEWGFDSEARGMSLKMEFSVSVILWTHPPPCTFSMTVFLCIPR